MRRIPPGASDGLGDLLGIERIDDHGLRTEVPQRRPLGLAPRCADDAVAGGDQAGHELLTHGAGRACDEHVHFRLL
jgi:hypothetical protein